MDKTVLNPIPSIDRYLQRGLGFYPICCLIFVGILICLFLIAVVHLFLIGSPK